jgi:putative ABC transport system ATP-binding protein
MSIIILNDISKNYTLGKVEVPALHDVSMEIEEGDFITLIGPSGSGKSTLLNLIGLIDSPTQGEIRIDRQEINHKNDRQLTYLRKEYLGFIFQNFNLIPVLTVYENIEYPLLKSRLKLPQRKELISGILSEAGLEGLGRRFPNEISGGQQQRVAIARAFVKKPKIVIADEPTANLDSKTGRMIIDLMHRINLEYKATFIMATHDRDLISGADHVINLLDGRVTAE